MLGYAAYMYVDYEQITFASDAATGTRNSLRQWLMLAHKHGSPW